ncbi:4'-phosphopantetheinyl transferase family protein [Zavarzinia aquatilis]|uniref:Phosphopantetheine-protein transferase n=1 Tax=Zavarzinia aquatilis TaxID=2211142 RepID=A0A317E253_9PROT|nr:4'-phosphopantetheinyl transferase superfamily protein [Zavarzinia aquatilis]PWR21167.1 phosphopantetheine-protein transferase [Zavarzinia aquatilis]
MHRYDETSPAPEACRADVWLIDLELSHSETQTLDVQPSFEEQRRAAKFRRPLDRRRFLRSRGALRRILSDYTGQAPAGLDIGADENGRPRLADPSIMDFNSSRSGNFALIALTRHCRIGVDIEQVQADFPCMDLAKTFFSRNENTSLGALPTPRRTAGFFQAWVSKEACVKAWGMGLSLPLDSFDVCADPSAPAALLDDRSGGSPLWLYRIAAPDGYAATVAADRPLASLRLHTTRHFRLHQTAPDTARPTVQEI